MNVINTHVSQHCHTFTFTTTFAKVAMLLRIDNKE